jgi:hypothetical protein
LIAVSIAVAAPDLSRKLNRKLCRDCTLAAHHLSFHSKLS